jgi:hypothetical protein
MIRKAKHVFGFAKIMSRFAAHVGFARTPSGRSPDDASGFDSWKQSFARLMIIIFLISI